MSKPDLDYETAAWEVRTEDVFDREAPTSRASEGRGLLQGLIYLWERYLFVTVDERGVEGFDFYWLNWEGGSVHIKGDREGARKLREWTGGKSDHLESYYARVNSEFLGRLAEAHLKMIGEEGATERILAAAAQSSSREEFSGKIF